VTCMMWVCGKGLGRGLGRVGFVGMISIDEMLELAMGRRCAENTGLYIC